MHRPLMILLTALLALSVLTPMSVQAQSCSSEVTNLQFGTIPGAPTPATDSTAHVTVKCSGTPGTSVRVCLGVSAGAAPSTIANRVMVNGGSSVAYRIDASPGGPIWGDNLGGSGVEATVAIASNGLGTTMVTMYGRVAAGQNVAAGPYASNLVLTSRQPSGNSPCINGTGSSFASIGFSATVMIAGTCTITASPLNFGSTASLVAGTLDSTGGLSVTCTAGLPYAVKLDGGLVGGAVGNRRMGLDGAGPGVIGYQLYRDGARSQAWGDTAGTTVTGTGNGAAAALTVYGRVPAQATPAAGAYRDTVTATVEY